MLSRRRLPRIRTTGHSGTGLEVPNTDALLLLARCEGGRDGAVKAATAAMHGGNITRQGRTLSQGEIEALLRERLAVLEGGLLDKYAEIGVISVAG